MDWSKQLEAAKIQSDPEWLSDYRKSAREDYQGDPWPKRHKDNWKYTDIKPILSAVFEKPVEGEADVSAPSDAAVVLINGRLRRRLSNLDDLPEGISIKSFDEANVDGADDPRRLVARKRLEHSPFRVINGFSFTDGLLVDVADDAQSEPPVHIFILSGQTKNEAPIIFHPRLVINLGKRASAKILIEHVGISSYFYNGAIDLNLDESAKLDLSIVKSAHSAATHFDGTHATLAKDSRLHVSDFYRIRPDGEK